MIDGLDFISYYAAIVAGVLCPLCTSPLSVSGSTGWLQNDQVDKRYLVSTVSLRHHGETLPITTSTCLLFHTRAQSQQSIMPVLILVQK